MRAADAGEVDRLEGDGPMSIDTSVSLGRSSRISTRLRRVSVPRAVYPLVGCLILVLIWQVYVWLAHPKPFLIPSPGAVWDRLVSQRQLLTSAGWVTARIVISGYLLAVVVSLPLAVAIAYVRVVERVFYPILVVLQVIPKIALAPVFVIWFGFGFQPKLLITFLLCFFPNVVDGVSGFKAVNIEVMEFARSTGAGRWRLFRKIQLPTALPYIFTGLKVSATMATTAAVVAEFVASDNGLGYLLLEANGNLETSLVFADVVVLGAMGLVLYLLIELVERLVIPWHTSTQLQAGASM